MPGGPDDPEAADHRVPGGPYGVQEGCETLHSVELPGVATKMGVDLRAFRISLHCSLKSEGFRQGRIKT